MRDKGQQIFYQSLMLQLDLMCVCVWWGVFVFKFLNLTLHPFCSLRKAVTQ